MADEITSLVVAVDSTSAKGAVADLNSLAGAGDKAESSVKKLDNTFSGARFSDAKLSKVSQSVGRLQMSLRGAQGSVNDASSSLDKARFSPGKIISVRQAVSELAASLRAVEVAAPKAGAELEKVRFDSGRIMRARQGVRELSSSLQENAKVSAATATANKVVSESNHQVAKAAAGYTKTAKEMAFATRGLPAQFTDIAVSLQAGQNPLTVFLQQGGQLKDMFGGIGPAARAMGGYVLGLINPFTLAAGAAAALLGIFGNGESEITAFNKSLVMTGNYAGTTVSGLNDMADRMERVGVTGGRARDTLAEIGSTGQLTASQIEMVATAAINLERETGRAVGDTAKEFIKLKDAPLDAVLELNKGQNFLTTSVYNQIKALEQQGDVQGAAQVAMEAYADSVNQRTAEVEANLGTLGSAWRTVTSLAKGAWDAMLDIGRPGSGAEKFNDLHTELVKLQEELADTNPNAWYARNKQARITEIRRQMQELSNARVDEQKRANAQMQAARATQALADSDAETSQYRQLSERRKNAIIKAEGVAQARITEAMLAGDEASAQRIRDNLKVQIAGINDQMKDPAGRKDRSGEVAMRAQAREYENLNERIAEHRAVLTEAGQSEEKLTSIQRFAIKTIAELDGGFSKLSPTQRQKIKDDLAELTALDAVNEAREKGNKLLEINRDINARLAASERDRDTDHTRGMRGIGLGRDSSELMARQDDVRDQHAQARYELAEKYGDLNAQNSAEYLDQLAKINSAEERRLARELDYMAQRQAAQSDWRNGARSAMEDIASEVNDVAGRTRDGFISAFQSMNQAVDRWAATGKLKVRDFATTVIAELARIALQIALSKALSAMFGGATGGSDINAGGSVYQGSRTAALGAVAINGQLTSMSKGGVRTSPMLSTMANGGTLLAGEHQAEGILPLRRGADGKLGVQSHGGGGSSVVVNTTVNINNDGSSDSRSEASGSSAEEGRRLGELLTQKVRQTIAEERQQGGLLWQMANGR